MKLSELIAQIGDDNVTFQNLDNDSIKLDYSAGKGSRITFGTEMPLTPTGTEKLGLVIWLPRDAVERATTTNGGGES